MPTYYKIKEQKQIGIYETTFAKILYPKVVTGNVFSPSCGWQFKIKIFLRLSNLFAKFILTKYERLILKKLILKVSFIDIGHLDCLQNYTK